MALRIFNTSNKINELKEEIDKKQLARCKEIQI